ncbi:DUF6174 domain-containing protein [Serinicoccus hydrothermalis]|uniref:DUF6174 domain-containing protein n=1 Tax=Serinicoccus hydrothermalis TaxID=1758689 RepID=UPI00300399A7
MDHGGVAGRGDRARRHLWGAIVVALSLSLSGCATGSATAPGAAEGTAREGDTATWQIGSAPEVTQDGAVVNLLVTRLGCAGGVTGPVLDPVIDVEPNSVVISTPVEARSGAANCLGNDTVPLEVQLGPDALGKDLVDAACLDGAEAAGTAPCDPGPARWHLPSPEPAGRIDWAAPDTYTFQVTSMCGQRAFLGTFEIDVAGGEVTALEPLGDRFGESTMSEAVVESAMTLEDIVEEANRGGVARRVALDAEGTPRYVSIGRDPAQSDSTSCYFIHEFIPHTTNE